MILEASKLLKHFFFFYENEQEYLYSVMIIYQTQTHVTGLETTSGLVIMPGLLVNREV